MNLFFCHANNKSKFAWKQPLWLFPYPMPIYLSRLRRRMIVVGWETVSDAAVILNSTMLLPQDNLALNCLLFLSAIFPDISPIDSIYDFPGLLPENFCLSR